MQKPKIEVYLPQWSKTILLLMLIVSVGFLIVPAHIDWEWMAHQWHSGYDNGQYWNIIVGQWQMYWWDAYFFTMIRIVVGWSMFTVSAVLLYFQGKN